MGQLLPDIMVGRFLLKAEQAVRDQDFTAARAAMAWRPRVQQAGRIPRYTQVQLEARNVSDGFLGALLSGEGLVLAVRAAKVHGPGFIGPVEEVWLSFAISIRV